MNIWDEVLAVLRPEIADEDYRRWFIDTAYASDSGDQITIWVPTEAVRRHIDVQYQNAIDRALAALDRANVHVRFVVTGMDEDEDDV